MFGKPKEGAHSYRVFDIAIVDVIFTILGGIVIAYIFNLDYTNTIIILFILGIVMHRLFCVETTVDKFLFSKS